MMPPAAYYDLSAIDVAIAGVLILVNGLISLALGLQLERRLLIASVRTVVQLLLIGYVLEWIFGQSRWDVIGVLIIVMTVVAGVSAVRRVPWRHPGIWIDSITGVMASSWMVTVVALTAVIRPEVWREHPAQYAVPLLGMILGNTLNGISLGLDRLGDGLSTRRREVEMRLTLGATRWEAARPIVRDAIRTGMVPIINSMMVVGLVSLPGMMTGQLLSGVSPLAAVKYQIAIMFLIAAGTALGTVSVCLLGFLRLFDTAHRFRYERLRRSRTSG
jgi:putative ABC transport system permease protein